MTTIASSDNDRRNKSYWLPLESEETSNSGDTTSEQTSNSEETPNGDLSLSQKNKPELPKRVVRAKEVANTSIYVVAIDDIPKFYSNSLDDAIRKARNFLQINRTHFDRQYYIDNLPNGEIHLTSVNKFFLFQNESLEHVAKIFKIPQVRFMSD